MRRGWRWLGIGVLAIGLQGYAVAQTPATGRGFVISPAFQELQVRSDQPQGQYTLRLTNQSVTDQNFALSVVDFGSLDEEGGVAFLGSPASELEHKYGLASWMRLEKDAVVVKAGSSVQLTVTVENRPSLAPGGHYGAVLATAVNDAGQTVGEPRVGVKQVLSSLLLATKEGGGAGDLRLVSQDSDHSAWHLPTQMTYRFQNADNVHVVPRGVTEVRDPAGHLVSRGAINEGSAAILPGSFRHYKSPITSVATAWMPGVYTLKTTYRYDGTEKTKVLATSVWYAGMLVTWAVIALVLVLIGGAIWLWRRGWRPRVRWRRRR